MEKKLNKIKNSFKNISFNKNDIIINFKQKTMFFINYFFINIKQYIIYLI